MKSLRTLLTPENNMSKTMTILAADHSFEGKMTCTGTSQIDGTLTGTIDAHDDIVLGVTAKVEGDLLCRKTVTILGEFKGKISSQTIDIKKTAKIFGDLEADVIMIESAAQLNGKITMPRVSKEQEVVRKDTSSIFGSFLGREEQPSSIN